MRPRIAVPIHGRADPAWPPGVRLEDGLDEDEAVAVALWNSPGFQADLAALDISRGDLIEAGMIRNPLLTLLLPLGPKQLELTAALPIEALWQRPRRIAAAQIEVERVARGLVQSALDLVRDAVVAVSEVALAEARRSISARGVDLRRQIATIAASRLRAGEISVVEEQSVQLDLARAEEELLLSAYDESGARLRLLQKLGLPMRQGVRVIALPLVLRVGLVMNKALPEALALRPDVRAAELSIEAAAGRVGWERSKAVNQIAAIADANGQGKRGFEMGPGFQIELPIGNRNQGSIARARGEMERAAWQYVAARHRVETELRQADAEYAAARSAIEHLRTHSLPAWDDNVRRAERAFAAGEVSHLFVLEAIRQRLDAALREVELEARLRRAGAELDRCLGERRL